LRKQFHDKKCIALYEPINAESPTPISGRCNFPTKLIFISAPAGKANCKRNDMALTKQMQQDWEETMLFEREITEKLFDQTNSEGETELLAGMLCMSQKYREILENRVAQF
jgi:hypothetical protein